VVCGSACLWGACVVLLGSWFWGCDSVDWVGDVWMGVMLPRCFYVLGVCIRGDCFCVGCVVVGILFVEVVLCIDVVSFCFFALCFFSSSFLFVFLGLLCFGFCVLCFLRFFFCKCCVCGVGLDFFLVYLFVWWICLFSSLCCFFIGLCGFLFRAM